MRNTKLSVLFLLHALITSQFVFARTLTWQELNPSPLKLKVDHHVTFIHEHPEGPYLYVYGGVEVLKEAPKSLLQAIVRARILPDGSLGPWSVVAELQGFNMHALAQTKTHAYFLGGIVFDGAIGNFRANKTTLIFDLTKGNIIEGPEVPFLNMHATAVTHAGNVYLIGGATNMHETVDRVVVSKIAVDGTLEPWRESVPLPKSRSHHTTLVVGERIYVMAGLNNHDQSDTSILASVHDADGNLISWESVGDIPKSLWTSSGIYQDDYVYLIGGGSFDNPPGATMSDKVLKGKVEADGKITHWEELANTLPMPRAHVHQTPAYNGRIYSVGGRDHSLSTIDKIFVGTFE